MARLAEVSAASVSAVINGGKGVSPELAKRIQKDIELLDWHPDILARSLRVRPTDIIGVIMSQIASPFFAEVLQRSRRGGKTEGLFNSDLRFCHRP